MDDSKKKQGIILAIIIAAQVIMLIYVGFQKQEYHIDEIYSYMLSNSYDSDKIARADWMWNDWISGEDFHDFVAVQENERFAYSTVYYNNSLDCHPPLFYWILHTVCSFTPNVFSKWSGLSINIALFAISAVFVYLISNELLKSPKWKFLPVTMWGFSALAVDTCTFIRMYMLLTTITIYFVYLHVKMFRNGITIKQMILIWITIYLGAMTQYYSLLVSFWGVLLFSLYLLRKNEIKAMFTYGIGACISVGAMFLSYPYIFEQATGNSTNNVGNEVARSLFNIKLWIKKTVDLAYSLVSSISYHWALSLLIVLVLIVLLLIITVLNIKNKSVSMKDFDMKETYWILLVCVFSFLSISFIGGRYVYLRYIYYIIPLIYIVVIVILEKLLQGKTILSNFILVMAVLFAISNAILGTVRNYSSYLFQDTVIEKEKLEAYKNQSLYVIVDKPLSSVPTGNLTRFEMFDKIYMAPKDDIIENNMISNTLQEQGACVVYIGTNSFWLNAFNPDEVLSEALVKNSNAEYEEIAIGGLGEFYYIHE